MLKEQIKFYKWKLSERHPNIQNHGKFIELLSNYLVPQARGIISYPLFLLAIFYGLIYYSDLNTVLHNILLLNIGNFILYMAFSTTLLGGLGEGWRYISFSSYFTTPVFFVLALQLNLISLPLIAILILASIVIIYANKGGNLHNPNHTTFKIFDACQSNFNKDSIFVGIPYYTTIPLLTSKRVDKIVSHQLGDLCDSFVKKFMVTNNFFKIDAAFIEKYSITHILYDENHLMYNNRKDVASILDYANLIYSLDGIHLYKIDTKNLTASLSQN
jgi:hypothetical protein